MVVSCALPNAANVMKRILPLATFLSWRIWANQRSSGKTGGVSGNLAWRKMALMRSVSVVFRLPNCSESWQANTVPAATASPCNHMP